MASRLPLCVLIVLCVSQLANGSQSSRQVGGLDALKIHKQRGNQLVTAANEAVRLKLTDGTGTVEPMTTTTGSEGPETTTGESTTAGPTSDAPFDTTSAAGFSKDPYEMTMLNIILLVLCAVVLVVDVALIAIKCKKN
uniref:Uncharacterized protein n=1 Tax=Globodera rostochiensis TaxID=31243 RepID=A0A914IBL8_GLORO